MGRRLLIFMVFGLFLGCQEENPTPGTFLDYKTPRVSYLDENRLLQLDNSIKKGKYGDIHSLIIIRNDLIVYENYYNGYHKDDLHKLGSATQSVISGAMGALMLQNNNVSLKEKLIDLLPGYKQYFDNVPQKDKIEIRHLLTNTSGLWWDEVSAPFGDEQNDAYAMTLTSDWVATILSTPMIREPGDEFNYNSGNSILLAPTIEALSGMEVENFVHQYMFEPLGITEWSWDKIPGGQINTAWGLHLRPIDMAKIGYLSLKNGLWNGNEIFDTQWAGRSTRSRIGASILYNYGYLWWQFSNYHHVARGINLNDIYFAWGDEGQFIFVIPHLDMVVVTTAGNKKEEETMGMEMLRDFIFTSVTDRIP